MSPLPSKSLIWSHEPITSPPEMPAIGNFHQLPDATHTFGVGGKVGGFCGGAKQAKECRLTFVHRMARWEREASSNTRNGDLVVTLKREKAIGLEIPLPLLVSADDLIE